MFNYMKAKSMTDQTYHKIIEDCMADFKKWGYDLHDIAREENMVRTSPVSHFKHGTMEQDAVIHALALYEADLYENLR